jgi:hypothetical protein
MGGVEQANHFPVRAWDNWNIAHVHANDEPQRLWRRLHYLPLSSSIFLTRMGFYFTLQWQVAAYGEFASLGSYQLLGERALEDRREQAAQSEVN